MGARRFSPGLHSFIQDDRYENALDDMELSQDPLTQNRYSLAGGNPVSFVETDGHDFDPIGAVEDAAEDVGDAVSDAGEAIKDSADEALEVGKFVVGDDPLEIGLTVLTTVGTGGTGLIAKTAAKGAFKGGAKLAAKKGSGALSKAPSVGRGAGSTARGSSAGGRKTTVLVENMDDRVIPYAKKTGGRTVEMEAKTDWAKMTPKQRWKANDGALRKRIREGDNFEYIGTDPKRSLARRKKFDLTRSEMMRLRERGVPFRHVPRREVQRVIGRR